MQERFSLWKFLSFVISLHFTPFIISECFLYFQHLFEVTKVAVLHLRSAINHWYQDSTLLILVFRYAMVANIYFLPRILMKIQSIIPKKRVTIMKRPYGIRRNPKRRKFIKIYLGGSVPDCEATEKVAFSREKMILLQTSQTFLKKKSYTHLPKYHNMHSP